jgi:hypothetical protein
MAFDSAQPFDALPPLPPAAELVETPEILKKCITARVALAELKQLFERNPIVRHFEATD